VLDRGSLGLGEELDEIRQRFAREIRPGEALRGLEEGRRVDDRVCPDLIADREQQRLLALHPGIARANLHTALLLGDAETVSARLTRDPSLATTIGGPRGWQPLHYVCYTSLGARSEAREAGLVAIGRRLIELGADPNLRFPWRHHEVERPVLWGAVFVVRSLRLARVLLDAGGPAAALRAASGRAVHDATALLTARFLEAPAG